VTASIEPSIIATCQRCGRRYLRSLSRRSWQVLCYHCWQHARRKCGSRALSYGHYCMRRHWSAHLALRPQSQREVLLALASNLDALIKLCHPDLHGNSVLSNDVTAWLLTVRYRLPGKRPTIQ